MQVLERRRCVPKNSHANIVRSSPTYPHNRRHIDFKRLRNQVGYASLLWTPLASVWYRVLDRAVLKLSTKGTIKNVACKLALELTAMHPVSLAMFFGCMGMLQGHSLQDIAARFRAGKGDFWPTLAFEVCLWAPLDVALFSVVPVPYQLLAVDVGCFVESVALSWINANGVSSLTTAHGGPSAGK